jgi:hypothetical protein
MLKDRYSSRQIRTGKITLDRALLCARELRSTGKVWSLSPESVAGVLIMPHLRLKNLHALVIYQPDIGGWIGDILLKKVPAGMGDVIGTPSAHPLPSRADAWMVACGIIATIIEADHQRKFSAPDQAVAPTPLGQHGWV